MEDKDNSMEEMIKDGVNQEEMENNCNPENENQTIENNNGDEQSEPKSEDDMETDEGTEEDKDVDKKSGKFFKKKEKKKDPKDEKIEELDDSYKILLMFFFIYLQVPQYSHS